MTMQPIYDGPVLVRTDASGSLADFGYTEDGVEWEFDEKRLPVYGDQFGGPDGPPIDIQTLSGVYIVRMVMTKYDTSALDVIESSIKGGTLATANTPGTLLFTDSKFFRLLLSPTSRPRNFLRAVPIAVSGNKGVKHSKPSITWECHQNSSGTYFNTTTS